MAPPRRPGAGAVTALQLIAWLALWLALQLPAALLLAPFGAFNDDPKAITRGRDACPAAAQRRRGLLLMGRR
jgi:hypothetical protein